MKWIHKVRALSWSERRLLAGAVLLLLGARAGLALFPFRTVLRFVDTPRGDLHREPCDSVQVQQIVWAVRAAARRVLGPHSCLPQALVVQGLLVRAGCPVRLCIGVARKEEGAMQAHAWVEHEGEVLIGGAQAPKQYTRLRPAASERWTAPAGVLSERRDS